MYKIDSKIQHTFFSLVYQRTEMKYLKDGAELFTKYDILALQNKIKIQNKRPDMTFFNDIEIKNFEFSLFKKKKKKNKILTYKIVRVIFTECCEY